MTIGISTRRLATVLLVIGLAAAAHAALPEPQGRVNDFASVLDSATRGQLTATLLALEQETTAEVAVATVPSLEGETIESYATQLFNQWGIGKKGVDNGVLVLVAPNDRQVRIEVGYGLEPILPDGLAGDIIRKQFLPKFREQNFDAGIRDGVARIALILRERHVLTPEERRALDEADRRHEWLIVPFLGLFVGVGAVAAGLGARAKAFGAILFGAVFGGMPLFMGWLTGPTWTGIVLVPFALAMVVLGFTLGKRDSWRSIVRPAHAAPGWVMGGSGRSGSSSSRSSGGSFGGGRSGGGGASGRW